VRKTVRLSRDAQKCLDEWGRGGFIVLSSTAMKTLPLGLAGMMDDTNVEYSTIMAESVFASLPIIVLSSSSRSASPRASR